MGADGPQSGGFRTAETIAALSLATDMALGFPLEHGLRSAVIAMRLCDRLGVDEDTASQTFFFSLLFYVGCNAPVDVGPDVFGDDDSLTRYGTPYRFGNRAEMLRGVMRAVAPPTDPPHLRAWRIARHLPELAIRFPGVIAANCEVGRMLTDELGLSDSVSPLFAYESERWDGKGLPSGVADEGIPLAVRIAHVARDAAFQHELGDAGSVAETMSRRAGNALDPTVAGLLARDAAEILDREPESTQWEATLASEPEPWLTLADEHVDRALAAMGHFSEMAIPELIGHAGGVAQICRDAAQALSLTSTDGITIHRAALVHDLGRVAVPIRTWAQAGALSSDDWEKVRLHAYHTERMLRRSSRLSALGSLAGRHHERLDGSGYHRGIGAPNLDPPARLLAVADAYHAMLERRPHRLALSAAEAATTLTEEARAGRLAPDAVAAVLEVGGHDRPPIEWPAGLTDREVQVVVLLARGMLTKQVARSLTVSPKTADFHIQSAYRKMGVSTRAGATLFAMQHGLVTWENSQ